MQSVKILELSKPLVKNLFFRAVGHAFDLLK